MIAKTYIPQDIESEIYSAWTHSKAFVPCAKTSSKPYCIMMPPPNVTGHLHMGHALNTTLQDIYARYQRMCGRSVLWQPGMDHAGIATQMVVERALAAQGNVDRRTLGREAFVEKVWQWKEQSGGAIARQLRCLGASCDWSRDRFTMDAGLSLSVRQAFVSLYQQGLIYKDKKLVNWDPHFCTAVSDLEVQQKETEGFLWHFRYPLEQGPRASGEVSYVVVATTRPETMFGDSAIAVHPEDARYKSLVGSHALLPLVGRRLPIVADSYADPKQGTGAVKITPAHDFNDFEVGKRHDLELVDIFDDKACLNGQVPKAYQGLDRTVARRRVVEAMEKAGLLVKVEPHVHTVPHGDRSQVVIEPRLTKQWYVEMKSLAQRAMEAVDKGDMNFVPSNWKKTYFQWLLNIQPWCISRQLWWGHRIPVWYGPDDTPFVAMDSDQAQRMADSHYGKPEQLRQDTDVLDTWFSSSLWPFATLGWPEKTPDLARYYSTNLLVTGFDIIFFWVARMMMMGLSFMKKVPFDTVYVHAIVRDEKGAKMSKSKGNVIDPVQMIDSYGADALRFALARLAVQDRDVSFSEQKVEGARNFITKLWNAARFVLLHECRYDASFSPANVVDTPNRWIISQLATTIDKVTVNLQNYKINEVADALYDFIWRIFCDWYVELAKLRLGHDTEETLAGETRATMAYVLEHILRLLHPIAPFVSEQLWKQMPPSPVKKDGMLIVAPWPKRQKSWQDLPAQQELSWVMELVSAIRSARAQMRFAPSVKLALLCKKSAPAQTRELLQKYDYALQHLARLAKINFVEEAVEKSLHVVVSGETFFIPLPQEMNIGEELARLLKEKVRAEQEYKRYHDKLRNKKFIENAPEKVINAQREKEASAQKVMTALQQAVLRLQTMV